MTHPKQTNDVKGAIIRDVVLTAGVAFIAIGACGLWGWQIGALILGVTLWITVIAGAAVTSISARRNRPQ